MNDRLVYCTTDCVKLIKRRYPWIPRFVIEQVLFAEECYMQKVGIIDYTPDIKMWKSR